MSILSPLLIVTITAALLAMVLFVFAVLALRRGRLAGGLTRIAGALLLLLLAGAAGLVSVATQGYRALTQETLAATVSVRRLGPQRFGASFRFPDGHTRQFELAGDELYVDAHILKWHPWANLLGLRTAFELDRVAGRYTLLDDEQTQPRTVYSLQTDKPVDMFSLVQRYEALGRLVDARYGSATFVPVRDGGQYRVLVSSSGLLVRSAE
ncbi:MAG TPA: hypothetical protein VF171_01655 [Trueperaceae bacterium]